MMENHGLSRRCFIQSAFGGVVLLRGGLLAAAGSGVKRPNVLWVSCEDISPYLGCYGAENAITPNLDRFAEEGVRYTRVFSVHGVCAPSRCSIITGVYPATLGTTPMRCRAPMPGHVRCFTEYLQAAGYYCTNNVKEDYNFHTPAGAWNDSSKRAHWKNRPAGSPFFAVFNFTGTHESKLWDSKRLEETRPERLRVEEHQDPAKMELPPFYPDTPPVRRDFARHFERITELDYYFKDRIDELKAAGLYEDTIVVFWSDHGSGLPRFKRSLYDTGTRVPLLVRVPEKYQTGGQGRPGSVEDRVVSLMDLGPSMLNMAGLKIPEHMQGVAFLGPRPGPEREYVFAMKDRIDEKFDLVRSVRDGRYRYIRNFYPFLPFFIPMDYAERCNTTQELRRLHAAGGLSAVAEQYMGDGRPAEELYDLEADPWEIKNLADDPAYAGQKERLCGVLKQWMVDCGDTGLLPEPEMNRLAEEAGSNYAILHGERSGIVRALADAAFAATAPKGSDRAALRRALEHDEPAVRYWGVVGQGNLAERSDEDVKAIRALADDESSLVRITVADVLGRWGQTAAALEVLIEELGPERRVDDNLYALIVLARMGEQARGALAAVKRIKAARPKENYVGRVADEIVATVEK